MSRKDINVQKAYKENEAFKEGAFVTRRKKTKTHTCSGEKQSA